MEVIFLMFSHFHWNLCLSTVSDYLWTSYTSSLKCLVALCSRPSFFLNLLQCMERCVCAGVETQCGPGSHLCVHAHPQTFAALCHVFSFSCLLRFTSVPNFLHLVCCFISLISLSFLAMTAPLNLYCLFNQLLSRVRNHW